MWKQREDNIKESSACPHAVKKKMVLRWKRMIQEIKIGGMYTGLSLWRNDKTWSTLESLHFCLTSSSSPHCDDVPFGSAQFVWLSAGSRWALFYVQWPQRITLKQVLNCVCVCVCPLIHRNAAHLVCQKLSTVRQVCLPAAGRPELGDDGWTPSHHHQVVGAHRLLLGLFPQILVFVVTQPRDGLKVRAHVSLRNKLWSHKNFLCRLPVAMMGFMEIYYRSITILITLSFCDIAYTFHQP